MRTLAAAALAAAVLSAAATAWLGSSPVRADSLPPTLYVSGLHIDTAKPAAFVELANRSSSSSDFYAIEVLFFHADGNRAAEPLDLTLPLLGGQSVSINVAGIVAAYRAANEIAPFKGPVELVITALTCTDTDTCPAGTTPRPFGPDVIDVSVVQTEGKAIYDANVQWRSAQ